MYYADNNWTGGIRVWWNGDVVWNGSVNYSTDDKWHHYAYRLTNSVTHELFIDGQLVATDSASRGTMTATPALFGIWEGNPTNGSEPNAGYIDCLYTWTRALTNAEMMLLYLEPYAPILQPKIGTISVTAPTEEPDDGSQSVKALGWNNPSTVGVPTIQLGDFITGAGNIASGQAFGTSTIVVNISPSGIASGETFGTAIIGNGFIIFPSGFNDDTVFGSARIVRVIRAISVNESWALGTASILPSTVSVSPTGIASDATFGTATILSGGVSIFVPSIPSTESVSSFTKLNIIVRPEDIASAEVFGLSEVYLGSINFATGGVVIAGQADVSKYLAASASGGSLAGDTARIYKLIPVIASGGTLANSTSVPLVEYRITTTGGGVIGGVASTNNPINGTGGAVVEGLSVVSKVTGLTTTGESVAAGQAIVYKTIHQTATGGGVVDSLVIARVQYMPTVSGGGVVTGAAIFNKINKITTTGGILVNSTATPNVVIYPNGGAVVSGEYITISVYNPSISGGVKLSGRIINNQLAVVVETTCRQTNEHLCCKQPPQNLKPVTKFNISNGITTGVLAASEVCKLRKVVKQNSYSNLISNLKRRLGKPATNRSGTTLYR
jgi:hypothetical protein